MRSLVIGYGNPSRGDDGAGLRVVNELRRRWGRAGLEPLAGGWDELGGPRDTLFLQQLTPELAATVTGYDLLILVDASLAHAQEPVRVEQVSPGFRPAAISHHLEPATLLALTGQLYGQAPQAFLVSVQGHDFDFGEELSGPTAAAVPEAVERVEGIITAREGAEPASGG